MKKDKRILAVVALLIIFLQIYVFCRMPLVFYENGFAIGLINSSKYPEVGINLMYVMIPVLFILFFTSGSIYEITHGYGKLLIIRNYSKTKLLLKKILKNTAALLLIVLIQWLAFLPFNWHLSPVEKGMTQSLLLYVIILHAIFMMQYLLEFFMPAHTANIILFIYCFASYYLVQVSTWESDWLKILLFPCLLYGMQNGAVNGEPVYYGCLAVGIFLNLLLLALCIREFKKTDIF